MNTPISEQKFRQFLDTIYAPEEMTDNHSLELAIQFIDNHEDYVKQHRRYLEFQGLVVLLHPCTYPRYYELLDKLLGFAKSTNDMQALTELCKSLELLQAPANVSIVKNAITTLLDHKAYHNAGELCEYLETNKQLRDTYHPHINSTL